jgi:hypothetical protein
MGAPRVVLLGEIALSMTIGIELTLKAVTVRLLDWHPALVVMSELSRRARFE